jgi:FKBP-type peptidyl-prolyl cis-trans isomerase
MTRTRSIALSLSVLSLAAAAVTGCGGSSNDGFRSAGSKIDGDPTTTLPTDLASSKSAPAKPAGPLPTQKNINGVSTDLSKKPKVPKATGAAPTELQASDVVPGSGPAAKSGDKVSVQYVGTLFNGGKQFDASWDRGKKPFAFTLGQGQVIAGWDNGVAGMKVGGRRVLVIPADQAYGANGSPPTIPANAPLVFVVDLKKIG